MDDISQEWTKHKEPKLWVFLPRALDFATSMHHHPVPRDHYYARFLLPPLHKVLGEKSKINILSSSPTWRSFFPLSGRAILKFYPHIPFSPPFSIYHMLTLVSSEYLKSDTSVQTDSKRQGEQKTNTARSPHPSHHHSAGYPRSGPSYLHASLLASPTTQHASNTSSPYPSS